MWQSVIKYRDPKTKVYLGSPSIIRLDNNNLLASHDYFGSGSLSLDGKECLTSVYLSEDDGITWSNLTDIIGVFWSSLFKHNGSVYLFGTNSVYGDIVIRKSEDNGYTWTYPKDGKSGLLFQAGTGNIPPNYHCSTTPVIIHNGRIYKAFEDNVLINRERDFASIVVSCDINNDFLDAENWTMSNRVFYNQDEDPEEWGGGRGVCWLEGNMVVAPDGDLWNILRISSEPCVDWAAIINVYEDGKIAKFKRENFIKFPGGTHKFTIRKDNNTGLYFTLSNKNTKPYFASQRNELSLHVSSDLIRWDFVCTLLKDDQELTEIESLRKTGFQYVDWQFDGDDIIYVVRTAYKEAHNFHDSNYIIFNKLKNYKSYLREIL
jgi:hypothetical protein